MEEALTLQQRMKRSRIMKAKSGMIARKRERALNKKADSKTIQKRAQKTARNIISKKMLQGRDKSELSLSSRETLEKKLGKKKSIINKIAKKLLPQLRKKEVERIKQRRGGDK
jgi:hypothetical protein|tara:strand:+ start:737 stop:1075 length:339 start_codon:yes stop_codon:yes gene_type:complete